MEAKKRCEKCLLYVKIYITCFKCDAAYHIYCWKKVPGAYVNQSGQLFCCGDLTSNCAGNHINLGTQDNPTERVIENENVDGYNEDLENSLIKQEDFEWDEFKCDASILDLNKEYIEKRYTKCPNSGGEFIQELKKDKDLENCLHKEEDLDWDDIKCYAGSSEFANKAHMEAHYKKSCNEEEEFIQDLNEDEADLSCSSFNKENFQKQSYEQSIRRCDVESSYSQLNKDNDTCAIDTKRDPAQSSDEEKKYKCADCKYSTCYKKMLVRHKCVHTNERPFKYDTCGYAAAQKDQLENHIFLTKHSSNAEKKYNCTDCKYSARDNTSLENHKRTHTNERPFKCDACEYAAAREFSLKSHILRKHSNAEKKYKCTDCKYSTHDKVGLVNHKRFHTRERPFKCQTCEYVAAHKGQLRRHILTKHSTLEKKYKCADCKYSTHFKTSLVEHRRTHTNERPFKCDTCEYAASKKGDLSIHIITKHSHSEKRHKCGHCEYTTHTKQNLLIHEYTHTNDRPHKCNMCDYATSNNGNLKRHILRKHSNVEKHTRVGIVSSQL